MELRTQDGDVLPDDVFMILKDVLKCVVHRDYVAIRERGYNGQFTVEQVQSFLEEMLNRYPANYIEPLEENWPAIIWETAVRDVQGDWVVACPMFTSGPSRVELMLTVLFSNNNGVWSAEIHDLKL